MPLVGKCHRKIAHCTLKGLVFWHGGFVFHAKLFIRLSIVCLHRLKIVRYGRGYLESWWAQNARLGRIRGTKVGPLRPTFFSGHLKRGGA